MKVENLGVIGCGQMGSGIVQVAASSGCNVWVCDLREELLNSGRKSIERGLERLVKKEKLSEQGKTEVLERISMTTRLKELSSCDLVIEAITEELTPKQELFEQLSRVLKEEAVVASNTSSLSITQLMSSSGRPDRFLGLHFFNPVPIMQLVEVVRTLATSVEALNMGLDFARALGKTPVVCEDRTGFLVNRLLIPYLLDAVRALETGTGSMEDIDQAMRLGCGYPMGPFQLIDFIGLDTVQHISNILFAEFGESRMAPPPTLKRLVYGGYLGRKSGKGFYDYSEGSTK